MTVIELVLIFSKNNEVRTENIASLVTKFFQNIHVNPYTSLILVGFEKEYIFMC